ncbi:MAG: hypothetical protein ACREIO_03030 [Nitrospiraceae bacterium]
MKRWALLAFVLGTLAAPSPASAEKPCDDYPESKRKRCETLWKRINADAASEMAQFGRTQLRRRQEGTISQEQHLRENMAFIKHSAEKRLELLSEQMGKE